MEEGGEAEFVGCAGENIVVLLGFLGFGMFGGYLMLN